MLVFGLYNTHGYTRSDDVINQLLLSRAIPGLSFDVIAYVESSPPKNSWHLTKTQNSWRVKLHKNSCPKKHYSLTHSLTHLFTHSLTLIHTRFRKMSKIILFIHCNSIYSFSLDPWLFLWPLFQYVCIQQSALQERYINDPEFSLHLLMISPLAFIYSFGFDSQSIWKWCRWSFGLLRG